MNQPNTHTLSLTAILTSLLLCSAVQAGTLYRWTDSEGQRHMETIIPADQAKLGYEVLDGRTFRVLRKVHRALNEEELIVAQQQQEADAAAERAKQQAERHDRTLLATYMSVDDMQMARNGQLRTLDSLIESTERTQERLQANLNDLIASAAGYERDGQAIPKRTEADISNVREQIERQNELIAENHTKQAQITTQFNADIDRFRSLKGIVVLEETVEPPPSMALPTNPQ
jgi:hypothetical protein